MWPKTIILAYGLLKILFVLVASKVREKWGHLRCGVDLILIQAIPLDILFSYKRNGLSMVVFSSKLEGTVTNGVI